MPDLEIFDSCLVPKAVSGDGFTLRWKVGCGGDFETATGHLVSPNYPDRVRWPVKYIYWFLPPSTGAHSTAHGPYLLLARTTLWEVSPGFSTSKARLEAAAGTTMSRLGR